MSADVVRAILRGLWDQYQTGGQDMPRAQDVDRDRESFLITGLADTVPVIVTVSERIPPEADRDEPARPVEDREPAGPYAPTRDGQQMAPNAIPPRTVSEPPPPPTHGGQVVRGRVVQADQEWLVERFDRISTRLDGQEQRLTEHLRLISTKVDFLNQVDESEGGEPLVTMTEGGYRAAKEAEFERGRQQGDADRGARESSEYLRGFKDGEVEGSHSAAKFECPVDHQYLEDNLRKQEFVRGLNVGKSERESELLDQGWTPPGAVGSVVHEISTYEVGRAALICAIAELTGSRDAEDEQILDRATWYRQQLMKFGQPTDQAGEWLNIKVDPYADVQTEPHMGTGND